MAKEAQIIDVKIEKFSLKGYGIALVPRKLEVAHSVPGDLVQVEWRKKRHDPQKGRLLTVLEPSVDRVKPRCVHVGICGGCCWQQMDYQAQLKEKQRRVSLAFKEESMIDSITPSEHLFGYRNKMEFSFSENRGGAQYLGLMIAQAEPYVFNVTECHLPSSWMAEGLSVMRKVWKMSGLSAYNFSNNQGTLRYITLREGMRTKEKMIILNVSGDPQFAPSKEHVELFVREMTEAFGSISLFLRIHQTLKGTPTQFYEMHLSGKDHIKEFLHLKGMDPLCFKISPSSFFQPNTLQAEKLYDLALEMLGDAHVVYDLYCGTGTLGIAAAKKGKKVIGIELSPEAVIDAKENAKENQLDQIQFYQGDVGEVLKDLKEVPPDAVFIDPPRAGLDAKAIELIGKLSPQKIIYISCNPITQAENVVSLKSFGYQVKRIQPVDQFPHTYHIENVVFLEK